MLRQPEERPCFDLYERAGGTTTLISTGPNEAATQDQDASYLDAAVDGTHVFFETQESLVPEDTDGGGISIGPTDIYEHTGVVTTLVSTSALNPNQQFNAEFGDVSEDGARVLFRTQEQLTADDTDGGYDVFERSGGQATRISQGSLNSNTGAHAKFQGMTPDGVHVFFDTPEQLEPEDADVQKGDIYRRSGNQTEPFDRPDSRHATLRLPVFVPGRAAGLLHIGGEVHAGGHGHTPGHLRALRRQHQGAVPRQPRRLIRPCSLPGCLARGARVLFTDTDGSKLYEYWNGQLYDLATTGAAIGVLTKSADASTVYWWGTTHRPVRGR